MQNLTQNLFKVTALSAMVATTITAGATIAEAKTVRISKTVTAGKNTKIDHYSGWKNDCSFLTINIDVLQKPKAGSTNAKVINTTISRAQVGSANHCVGKPTRALGIYYKAKPGYKGRDSMKIKMKVRGQRPVTFIYNIRVR